MKKNFLNFLLFLVIFIWSNFYFFLYSPILQNMDIYNISFVRYNVLFFGIGNLENTVKFVNIPSIVGLIGISFNSYVILKKMLQKKV